MKRVEKVYEPLKLSTQKQKLKDTLKYELLKRSTDYSVLIKKQNNKL